MDEDKALTLEALKYAASKGHGRIVREIKIAPFTIKGYEALAQSAQEPVCPECKAGVLYECVACSSNNYPPQRPWVGLTDEEISASSKGHITRNGFARAIEAKLKERNA